MSKYGSKEKNETTKIAAEDIPTRKLKLYGHVRKIETNMRKKTYCGGRVALHNAGNEEDSMKS